MPERCSPEIERHPGPFSGPDAELARAIAMAVIPWYGNDDGPTHERIIKGGIWNDHIAVQAALAAIHHLRTHAQCVPTSTSEECAMIAEGHVGAIGYQDATDVTPVERLMATTYNIACRDIAKAIRDAAPNTPPQPASEAALAEIRALISGGSLTGEYLIGAIKNIAERGPVHGVPQGVRPSSISRGAPTEAELVTAYRYLLEKPSTSYIQRKMGIGYNHAAAIMETLENEGAVTKPDNNGKRIALSRPPLNTIEKTDGDQS